MQRDGAEVGVTQIRVPKISTAEVEHHIRARNANLAKEPGFHQESDQLAAPAPV
jgi:hypothetical protein